jgi:hypothetical protein
MTFTSTEGDNVCDFSSIKPHVIVWFPLPYSILTVAKLSPPAHYLPIRPDKISLERHGNLHSTGNVGSDAWQPPIWRLVYDVNRGESDVDRHLPIRQIWQGDIQY